MKTYKHKKYKTKKYRGGAPIQFIEPLLPPINWAWNHASTYQDLADSIKRTIPYQFGIKVNIVYRNGSQETIEFIDSNNIVNPTDTDVRIEDDPIQDPEQINVYQSKPVTISCNFGNESGIFPVAVDRHFLVEASYSTAGQLVSNVQSKILGQYPNPKKLFVQYKFNKKDKFEINVDRFLSTPKLNDEMLKGSYVFNFYYDSEPVFKGSVVPLRQDFNYGQAKVSDSEPLDRGAAMVKENLYKSIKSLPQEDQEKFNKVVSQLTNEECFKIVEMFNHIYRQGGDYNWLLTTLYDMYNDLPQDKLTFSIKQTIQDPSILERYIESQPLAAPTIAQSAPSEQAESSLFDVDASPSPRSRKSSAESPRSYEPQSMFSSSESEGSPRLSFGPQLTKQEHNFIVRDVLTHLDQKQCLNETLQLRFFRNRINSTDISILLNMLQEQGMTFTPEEVRHYHDYVPETRRSEGSPRLSFGSRESEGSPRLSFGSRESEQSPRLGSREPSAERSPRSFSSHTPEPPLPAASRGVPEKLPPRDSYGRLLNIPKAKPKPKQLSLDELFGIYGQKPDDKKEGKTDGGKRYSKKLKRKYTKKNKKLI